MLESLVKEKYNLINNELMSYRASPTASGGITGDMWIKYLTMTLRNSLV